MCDGSQQETGNTFDVYTLQVHSQISNYILLTIQISVLKNILRENHRGLKRIQLFPTYAMQGIFCTSNLYSYSCLLCGVTCLYILIGHEFRALFISTVECVDSSGKTMNPTKSLCNPYVFNTAITRARSLVVAVGNPFTLLSVEANVAKPKYCWKEFIARCLEHNSFIIPDSVCDRPRDIPAEIQRILVTQAVPACLNKELLPVSSESHALPYLFMLYSSNSVC